MNRNEAPAPAPSAPVARSLPALLAGLAPAERSELVADAYEWVSDCAWREEPAAMCRLSDEALLYGVERHYVGGLAAFVEAGTYPWAEA